MTETFDWTICYSENNSPENVLCFTATHDFAGMSKATALQKAKQRTKKEEITVIKYSLQP